MVCLSIDKVKKDFRQVVNSCIAQNEIYKISTAGGNVVLLSEKEYNSLVESLYLAGIKNVYKDINKTLKTPTEKFNNKTPWN